MIKHICDICWTEIEDDELALKGINSNKIYCLNCAEQYELIGRIIK
jgi:hypothetical protein